jgi:hypothetical protein
VRGPRCGRKRRGVEIGKGTLGLVEAPDQQEPPDFEMARMRSVHAVTVLFERHPRGIERLRGPAQVARDEGDLGLGNDAARAGDGFSRPKGARRASHQHLRSNQITELRHRNAAQRQCRRVVAQRDSLQRAERITGGKRARRGRDHRVHRSPATPSCLGTNVICSRPADLPERFPAFSLSH